MWTYAVGLSDDLDSPDLNCPCAKYPSSDPPTFVDSHYYCASGNTGTNIGKAARLFSSDPLWDGAGCGTENSCCYDAGMPWFFRQFPTTTTGYIEVRICYDKTFNNEAVVVEQIQLYNICAVYSYS